MTLQQLQRENKKWTRHNFPDTPPYRPLLGALEELGELSHAHLKMEQGIRGNKVALQFDKEDAVGDVLIYLAHYCNINGIDMARATAKAWSEVKRRDWIKFPRNGVSQ